MDQSEIPKMEGFASAEEAQTSETIETGGDETYEEQDPGNCTRTRQGYVLVGGVQYWKPDVKKPQADSSQSHQSMAKAKPKTKGMAKPKAVSKAKAIPKTKAKGKAKPKAVSKAKAKPKTKAKAKAKPKPVSKAKAKPKTKAKSEDAVWKIWKHCQGAKVQK